MRANHLCGSKRTSTTKYQVETSDSRSQHDQWTSNHENSLKKFQSIKTVFNSINLKSISDKSTYCNGLLRSKSQNDFGNDRISISVKKKENNSLPVKEEVSEWFHIYSDKGTLNLWADKLQILAHKVQKPGGEEKLRNKIEKYLDTIPSQLSDDDLREFRQHLPDNIIRKLKKLYLKTKGKNHIPINVFRLELPKCYFYYENDKVKTVIRNWLRNTYFKNKDSQRRYLKEDEILDYMVHKLKPLLDMPNCHDKYIDILKKNIKDILKELPIVNNSCDKKEYFNRLTDTLIEKLLNTKNKKLNNKITRSVFSDFQLNVPKRRKQQIPNKLKQFIIDEVYSFFEKTYICLRVEQMNRIETVVADLLIDKIDSTQLKIDANIKQDIAFILKKVGKLPEFQAKYIAKKLHNHLESVLYFKNRIKYSHNRNDPKIYPRHSKTYVVCHNQNKNLVDKNSTTYFSDLNTTVVKETDANMNLENYTKQLIEQQLKQILNQYFTEVCHLGKDKNKAKIAIRQYEDTIDNWIDSIPLEPRDEASLIDTRYVHTHDLAVKVYNAKIKLIQSSNDILEKKLENDISDWLLKLPLHSQVNMKLHRDRFAKILVKSLHKCDYENPIDLKKEQEDQDIQVLPSKKEFNIDRVRSENDLKQFAENIGPITALNSNVLKDKITKFNKNIQQDHDRKPITKKCLSQKAEILLKKLTTDESIESIKDTSRKMHSKSTNNLYNIVPQNMTVYDMSIQNCHGNDTTNDSLKGITEDDINSNINIYLNQLKAQIHEWLTSLQIPEVKEKKYREEVVNDLAGDIVDRHKYLEINPSSFSTEEDELEHLRYQIFKWINKLVGEDNLITIEHAAELMQKIQAISVPMLVRPHDVNGSQKVPSCCRPRMRIAKQLPMYSSGGRTTEGTPPQKGTKIKHGSKGNTDSGENTPIHSVESGTNKNESSQEHTQDRSSNACSFIQLGNPNKSKDLPIFGSVGPVGSLTKAPQQATSRRMSSTGELGIHLPDEIIPQCKTLKEAFDFFYNAIREKSDELPIATYTPEQKTLANLAKRGILNAIVMNFHNMKSDPEIGSDYQHFELILEDRLDLMLDCLPQTSDLTNMRQVWKSKVIQLAIDLLKYIHKSTDSLSFRHLVARGINRKVIKTNLQQQSDRIMHEFIVKTANDFILYSNYKEEDPLKANIYRQRLMKKLEELAQYATTTGNIEFRYVDRVQLCQDAFKVLEDVPMPNNEELKEEADIILLDEEIEQWYNELPVKPISSESDNLLRNRMRELLAKKIHEMEKQIIIGDPSVERLIKHEISIFLYQQGQLEEDQDLNINFMVEELNNRLKNRRLQRETLGYQTFKQDKPLCSTFIQPDPLDALATLIDVQTDTSHDISGLLGYQGTGMPKELMRKQQEPFYEGIPSNYQTVNITDAKAGDRFFNTIGPCTQSCEIAGSGMNDPILPESPPTRNSLVPAQFPNPVPNYTGQLDSHGLPSHITGNQGISDNQVIPTIQDLGGSQGAASWSVCSPNMTGATDQRFLAARQTRLGTQVTGASSQGIRPCSSTRQYANSEQFKSTRFLDNRKSLPAQEMTSTAPIYTGLPKNKFHERRTSRPLDELEEDEERIEIREHCRCMERFRRRRRRYCYSRDDDDNYDEFSRFHAMPFTCICHY